MRDDFRGISTVLGLAAALVVFGAAASAEAFCRSTTCSEERGDECPLDKATGCELNGKPLAWRSNCLTFSVQRDGSPLNGIDAETFEGVISSAFRTWLRADCGGGTHPSIDVSSFGEVECNDVQFNQYQGNANIYMFLDQNWNEVHDSSAFAITTVFHDWKTGEILDVDVEVNGGDGDITNTEPQDGVDLPSIITHETGHFLGLADVSIGSPEDKPTMYGHYAPRFDNLRDLTQDDVDGVCTVYPPQRGAALTDCSPRRGFMSTCGTGDVDPDPNSAGCHCSTVGGRANEPVPTAWLALGAALVGVLRRKRR